MPSSYDCLHHLFPPVRSVSYSLRQRGHPYELLEYKYQTSGSAMAEGPRDALSVEILQLQNIPFEN